MKIEITAVPRYWLHLRLPTVKLLQRLSALHYDDKCKAASRPGGFLYGWAVTLSPYEGANVAEDGTLLDDAGIPPLVRASFEELDTVLKIVEFPPPMVVADRLVVEDLRDSLYSAIKLAESVLRPIQLTKD